MTAQTGDTIDILLATYNGAAFLDEQLDSIAAQTHQDWRLIARDDGSSDRTPEILDAFRTRHPDQVVVLADGEGNLGLVQNFSRLMAHSDAPYAAFCDQDDVWIPEKLELSLAKMRELEREHGAEVPLLVFTDLMVVDQDLKVIHDSFWRYSNLRPDRSNSLNRLLFQNVVTGCTALMNRALMGRSKPVPAEAGVHDWWVALVAAAFGVSGYIAQPTVRYRQHGQNLLGAKTLDLVALPGRLFQVLREYSEKRQAALTIFKQAGAFHSRYSGSISAKHGETIILFLKIPKANLLLRAYYSVKCRCLPVGMIRTAVFVVLSHGDY